MSLTRNYTRWQETFKLKSEPDFLAVHLAPSPNYLRTSKIEEVVGSDQLLNALAHNNLVEWVWLVITQDNRTINDRSAKHGQTGHGQQQSMQTEISVWTKAWHMWLIRVKKSHEGFRVSRDMSLLVQPWSPIHTQKVDKEISSKH